MSKCTIIKTVESVVWSLAARARRLLATQHASCSQLIKRSPVLCLCGSAAPGMSTTRSPPAPVAWINLRNIRARPLHSRIVIACDRRQLQLSPPTSWARPAQGLLWPRAAVRLGTRREFTPKREIRLPVWCESCPVSSRSEVAR